MLIYKIVDANSWTEALSVGRYEGSSDDKRDGFIHLSTARQTRGTLAKHFARRRDLVIVAVDAESLGDELKWEISRGGEKFPHLYAVLRVDAASEWQPLQLGPDGLHLLPRAFD